MGRFFAGIDSGSWNTKAVVIDDTGALRGKAVVRSGADLVQAARHAIDAALAQAGITLDDLAATCSTGFGRHPVRQHLAFIGATRTELDCHARGVGHSIPGAVTIIDIGGQDAKVIHVGADGRRIDHKMNRKCASGTGSFIEEIALRLGVLIHEFSSLAAQSNTEASLGSFCTVFAATELLAKIREGARPADLAKAAYKSVVKRVLEMAVIDGVVVATGGVVAHHPMVVTLLSEAIGHPVIVPEHSQEIGALGAALVARESATTTTTTTAPATGESR